MRGLPLAVQLLLVNQLGVNTGFSLLVPYLATHLGGNLGMSAAVVGIVIDVRNLSRHGLFIIGGSASDRLGARGVIIAGCALRTAGFGLFALGDHLTVLLAASVVIGHQLTLTGGGVHQSGGTGLPAGPGRAGPGSPGAPAERSRTGPAPDARAP